jgi:hypothetical protein
MEKLLLEAIYELTQSVQILALKVDELDKNTARLAEHKLDVINLSEKLGIIVRNIEQNNQKETSDAGTAQA